MAIAVAKSPLRKRKVAKIGRGQYRKPGKFWPKDEEYREWLATPAQQTALGLVRERLSCAGLLEGRSAADWRVLHSLPECTQQGLHTDYQVDDPSYPCDLGARQPAGGVLALMDGTTLDIGVPCGDSTGEYVRHTLPVPVGWAVIFDGSVVHAGSKYTQHNTRVHLYLDVPSFAREPGYMSYVLERV